MPLSREELIDGAKEAGYSHVDGRLISQWIDLGLLPKGQRIGRGAKGGRGAKYEWGDKDLPTFISLLGQQRVVRHLAIVAIIPVATWLYWGDEWTQLPQVRRAIRTWWARTDKVGAQASERLARSITRAVAPRETSRVDRDEFKSSIQYATFNRTFAREEIISKLDSVRRSDPTDGLIGQLGIPSDLLVDGMFAMRVVMGRLKDLEDSGITDEMFQDARRRVNLGGWQYLKQWPQLHATPNIGESFERPTIELFVNHACSDLLRDLGMQLLLRERGTPLPASPEVTLLSEAFKSMPAK